jgi:glycosyltransferase involved in cell wall biosynthesis
MSLAYSKSVHEALLNGTKKAIGWGISADIIQQLHRAPYDFSLIIDGLRGDDEKNELIEGVTLAGPSALSYLNTSEYVVVVFADPEQFGTDIKSTCLSFGIEEITLPFCYWQHEPEAYMFKHVEEFLTDTPVPTRANDNCVVLWLHTLAKGGAEWQMFLLALGLVDIGKEVHLITAYADHPNTNELHVKLEKAGVHRHQIPTMRDTAFDYTGHKAYEFELLQPSFLLQVKETEKLLKKLLPQQAISFLDGGNIVLGLASARIGMTHTVMSGRGFQPAFYPHFYKHPASLVGMSMLYKYLLEEKNIKLVNNSRAGALSYERWVTIEEGAVKVINNAVPQEDLIVINLHNIINVSKNKIIIGGVMRLTEEKQPDWFIHVTSELIRKYNQNIEVVIVGDGHLNRLINKQINDLDIAHHYHLIGTVEDAIPYIAAMDLLILTSIMEGTPNVLIEAQMHNTAFVANAIGGVAECVYPPLKEHSLSITPSIDELIDLCITQLDNRDRLSPLRTAARNWILNRTPALVANEYLEIAGD